MPVDATNKASHPHAAYAFLSTWRLAPETALDDATYDSHTPGDHAATATDPGASIGEDGSAAAAETPAAATAAEADGSTEADQASPRDSEGSGSGAAGKPAHPVQFSGLEKRPAARPSRFDRLVSTVWGAAQQEGSTKSGSSATSASVRAGTATWQRSRLGASYRRLTSGYIRRAVSARFGGGRGARGGQEGDGIEEEEGGEGGKPAPAPGKSGALGGGVLLLVVSDRYGHRLRTLLPPRS